jgi:hypothetical protein
MVAVEKGEMSLFVKNYSNKQNYGCTVIKRCGKILKGEDGTVPVGVNGHDEIKTGKRKCDGKEKDIYPGIEFAFMKIHHTAFYILLQRKFTQIACHDDPAAKIDDQPYHEKRHIQVWEFMLYQTVIAYG